MVLSSTAKDIDINGQTFDVSSKTSPFTSGRLIVTPTFSALGYQNSGVFNGFKILTDGSAEFSNSGITRFFNQVRFDNTLTNGTYNYTLPGATGTLALTSQLTGGTVTSVGLSSATSGVTIGSTPITTSGTITLAIATASGSQQGLLSSTDWTTFNNKQNALTNPVTGTGTTNYLPKFTGASTIGDSAIQTDGTGNLMVGSANAGNAGSVNISVGLAGTTSGGLQLWAATNQTHYIQFGDATSGAAPYTGYIGYAHNNDSLIFGTSTSTKMTLSASGNLGLGVNPSAWSSTFRFIDVNTGPGAAFGSVGTTADMANNAFTDGSWTYKTTGAATLYRQLTGSHLWLTAPSGTAGNAISFTQAMTLTSAGELCVGRTSAYGAGFLVNVQGNIYASAAIVADLSVTAKSTIVQSSGEDGSSGPVMRLTSTNSNAGARNWGIINTWDNFGDLTFRVSNAKDGNALSAGTSIMTMLRTGNVGIGTTSPLTKLDCQISATGTVTENAAFRDSSANGNALQIFNGNNEARIRAVYYGTPSDQNITFWTITSGGSQGERMRINAAGNVGIGTTSPSELLDVRNSYREPTSGEFTQLLSSTTTQDAGRGGSLGFGGFTNGTSSYTTFSGIKGFKENGDGGNTAGALAFYTRVNGGAINERMRITAGGQVLINRTSAASSEEVLGILAKVNTTAFDIQIGTNSYYGIRFRNSSGSQAGYIQIDASSVTYGTGSDYRLKKDFKDYSGLDLVSKINTYDFAWKLDNTRMYGVIAHELADVMPYAVSGKKDAINKDGSINPQGVDYSKIVPVLIKSIQELKQELDTLKNK
jgi:hypothetical protein